MAYKFLESKISVSTDNAIHFAKNIKLQDLDNPELRLENCGNLASKLAESDRIREELIFFQRDFTKKKVGAVLDGRDIGSVIFPDAKIKLFVTADLEVRAQRRQVDYKKMGQEHSLRDLTEKLKERDKRDKNRKVSPLICMPTRSRVSSISRLTMSTRRRSCWVTSGSKNTMTWSWSRRTSVAWSGHERLPSDWTMQTWSSSTNGARKRISRK